MHKQIGDDIWAQEMKKKLPTFRTLYYNLIFDKNQSMYSPGKEIEEEDPWSKTWEAKDEEDFCIYQNFENNASSSSKRVFEKLFQVQDSLYPIQWKITNDTRSIMGFECRKAVGKFFDSLYVVAFYTDEILTPSGPDNYSGLPGMILGVALPRFNTTIFATKLELINPKEADLKFTSKGKKVNRKEMFLEVKEATKNWGKEWQKWFWEAIL